MNRSISRRGHLALLGMFLALIVAAFPVGASADAETGHFQKESLKAYEAQLHRHEVHALTFHPGTGTGHLHISLNDGKHMTVAYASPQQSALVAQARVAGARVKIATVKAPKATTTHHKLRYIAAGILILVILVVLIVLLVGRRRAVAGGGGPPSEDSTAS